MLLYFVLICNERLSNITLILRLLCYSYFIIRFLLRNKKKFNSIYWSHVKGLPLALTDEKKKKKFDLFLVQNDKLKQNKKKKNPNLDAASYCMNIHAALQSCRG